MQMHVIATNLGDDWAGPYTDQKLLQKTLAIIQEIDPGAEIISKDANPFSEQIIAGLKPLARINKSGSSQKAKAEAV